MKIPSRFISYPTQPNGSFGVYNKYDPWRRLEKIYFCPCEDGKARTVRIRGEPDTFFSQPASVNVKGKDVSGFITCDENGYRFLAYKYGKNWKMMEQSIKEMRHDTPGIL